MQGQGGKQLYSGPLDAVAKLYAEGGLRSIYRGTLATVARDGPGSAAYFVVYEMIKKAMTPAGQDPSKLSLSAVMVAGGSAGVAMWTLAIPPDVGFPFSPHWPPPACGFSWAAEFGCSVLLQEGGRLGKRTDKLTSRRHLHRSSSPACRARRREPTRASSTAHGKRSQRTVPAPSSRASVPPWPG